MFPPSKRKAVPVGAAVVLLIVAAGYLAVRGPPAERGLIPAAALPPAEDPDALIARADALVARYPDDPRGWYARALRRSLRGDRRGAEDDLRRAVDRLPALRPVDPERRHEVAVRGTLAAMLMGAGREAEARAAVRPACRAGPDGGVPRMLGAFRLCE